MNYIIGKFKLEDLPDLIDIWNSIIDEGTTFPQLELLNNESGYRHFSSQTYTGVVVNEESGEIAGLYILHPNNVNL